MSLQKTLRFAPIVLGLGSLVCDVSVTTAAKENYNRAISEHKERNTTLSPYNFPNVGPLRFPLSYMVGSWVIRV